MYTLEAIREAHARVRSGADFPAYIQALKTLGVQSYDCFVGDGHIVYENAAGEVLYSGAKHEPYEVADAGDEEALAAALRIHQQGGTDYPTFCRQSAEAGVEKWRVDTEAMTCVYLDKAGKELITEAIPES